MAEITCMEETMYYLVLTADPIPVPQSAAEPSAQDAVDFSGGFRFTVLPNASISLPKSLEPQTVRVPVCRTRYLPYESGDSEQLAVVWDNWMKPSYDDRSWEVAHTKRGPLLYDHTGSRVFRFPIPAGTVAFQKPLPVKGEYALYINGALIEAVTAYAAGEPGWMPVSGCEDESDVLAIEVSTMSPQFGVIGAPAFLVKPYATSLTDWRALGLDWYSGFGMYEKDFDVSSAPSGPVWLDLGDVRECAEVILNGRSAGVRIWPPYRLDIAPWLRAGRNHLQILVCNLISNEYSWDPLGTRGGGERLASGLLGGVTITGLE